jgi:CBS domain-containing protein
VIDGKGQLAGVVSQTDLVYYNLTRGDELVMDSHFYHSARVEGRHVPRGFQFEDCNSGCVADVMTPVVHSVSERASVESVVRLMTRNHIHRVIVRRGVAVAGIISALDVLEARQPRAAKKAAPHRAAGSRRKRPSAGRRTR